MTQTPYLKNLLSENQTVNPLFAFLGIRCIQAENGVARLDLPVSRQLSQGAGVIAGGILATLADEAMAHAVLSLLDETRATVTTEMNIRYLRATKPEAGGTLHVTATVVKPGRSIMTTSAEILNDAGALLATAGGSFFVLTRD